MLGQSNSPLKSPMVQDIIISHQIGAVSVELAKRLGVTPVDALYSFYASETGRNLHDKSTGLYLYGNLYIADEFEKEINER